jgi:hypothetical protein
MYTDDVTHKNFNAVKVNRQTSTTRPRIDATLFSQQAVQSDDTGNNEFKAVFSLRVSYIYSLH